MKVAYFAESPADQAALTILTEAILGRQSEPVIHAGLRHRGWPMVRTVLRAVLLELHYNTDAEGFVFIVDSNGTPLHVPSHEQPNGRDPKCRLCQLQRIISEHNNKFVRDRIKRLSKSLWGWQCQLLRPGFCAVLILMLPKRPGSTV